MRVIAGSRSARVVFLGSGGAVNLERFQSAILVETAGRRVLLDTGGGLGLLHRLLSASVEPDSVGDVVLSHRHLDHVGGLEPLLITVGLAALRRGAPPPPITVHASADTAAALQAVLQLSDAAGATLLCAKSLTWSSPAYGEAVTLAPGLTLTLVAVDHLPPGGGAAACLLDVGGTRIAYSGDTRPSASLAEAARGVDLMIHEVGGLDAHAARVHTPGHSTAGDAGRVATAAGARVLALVHVPPSGSVAPGDLVAEARRFAPGLDVFLPDDGHALTI